MKYNFVYAFLIISCITATSCSQDAEIKTNSTFAARDNSLSNTAEQAMEKKDPDKFLSLTGDYRRNFLMQWVVKGSLKNNALLVSYKDISVNMIYYSETHKELGRLQKIIHNPIKPGEEQTFKYKSAGFPETASVGLEIGSAVADGK